MPSPKDGTANSLINPAAPCAALPADKADPGELEATKAAQRQSGAGKYGSTAAKPFKPGTEGPPDPAKPKTWIEIQLVDEEGHAVPGEAYSMTLPDGTPTSGTLDENGLARVDGIDPGNCQVTFPDLDGKS